MRAEDARRAALLRQRLQGRAGHDRPTLRKMSRDGSVPLSFAQEQLWFLQGLRPESSEYVLPVAVRLAGELDAPALAAALGRVTERHEILRSRILTVDGAPRQVIDPPAPPDLPLIDLTHSGMAGFVQLAGVEVGRPFDLACEPLLRARLAILGPHDHVLLIVVHHAVFDGWSMDVLISELDAAYSSLTSGSGRVPEPPGVQYGDYAAWQREWMSGSRLGRELDFWRDYLSDAVPTEVRTDRSRPSSWEGRGGSVTTLVPAELAAALLSIGRDSGATPFMVFLSALQILLGRYAGTTDMVIGTPVSGRSHPEVEPLIGFFVNSVVLRSRLDDAKGFSGIVSDIRQDALRALSHQDVPFDRLVAEISPERDLARHPLFQIAFALQSSPAETQGCRIGDLQGEILRVDNETAKFDLTWTMQERTDGSYLLDVQYATALYERETIGRMTRQFLRLLESVVADPLLPIGQLTISTDSERDELSRDPQILAPPRLPLHRLFAAIARRQSESPALVHQRTVTSYGELETRSNQLANKLRSLGVDLEDPVGLLMNRSADVVVAMLAVLKAGGFYVPLDPRLPADRISYMMKDVGADLVIVDREHRGPVDAPFGVTTVEASEFPDSVPDSPVHPDNLAYVIYTSGSTGQPKGVAVTHANIMRLFTSVEREVGFSAGDVWSCTHSFSFDFSVWELWAGLLYGGRTVIIDTEVARSPALLLDVLREERVSRLSQTPSAFLGLTEQIAEGARPAPSLRAVYFGGEALTPSQLSPWFDRFGERAPTFVNMFGITETTVHVTYREIQPKDIERGRSMIGRPIWDLGVRVLNNSGGLAAHGVPGEIHVCGPGLARGYWRRPALTAERFVPNPYTETPGSRMYRSGDTGRQLEMNDIEYLGRGDHQVKVRGFRIELGEVESALRAHPEVKAALVDAHGEGVARGLAAYVVPTHEGMPSVDSLRSFMLDRIPAYMLPAWWIELSALPLNASGKVDRRSLPAPQGARPHLGQVYVPPRDSFEKTVAEVWQQVLGLDDVGAFDNFFALGGDSIKAVRVVGRLAQVGIALTVADLFGCQTVAALKSVVGADQPSTKQFIPPLAMIDEATRGALPADVEDAYPVSALQAGMLYEMLSNQDLNLYHNVTSMRIRDGIPFDETSFRAAVDLLVERNEALRTSFDLDTFDQPLQLVRSHARANVHYHDLRSLGPQEQESALTTFARARRREPLEISSAPLIRFDIHQTGPEEFWLSVTECHAILDGWSHHVLMGELMADYRSFVTGQTPVRADAPLPCTRPRFVDFVAAEHAAMQSSAHRMFWSQKLSQAEPLAIPSGFADETSNEFHDFVIPITDLLDGLGRLAAAAGAPLKSVLLAAHLVALGEATGRRRFHTGLITNGRPEVEGGDDVRGMFLNTVPFVAELHAGRWVDLVRSVLGAEVELLPYRLFPLPAMKSNWADLVPVPEVVFNYLNFTEVDDSTLDHAHAADYSPNEAALHVSTEPGAMILTAHAARISRRHLECLGRLYREVLAAMADDPTGDAGRTFRSPETQQAWDRWNANDTAPPAEMAVRRIAAQRGQDVALVCGSQRLTYAELNRRANRLAGYLRRRGVGPEVLVAVCLRRNVDLVVALLAVLRAGGAYVPLDPRHPVKRLEYQVHDSAARFALTDSAVLDGSLGTTEIVRSDQLDLDGAPEVDPDVPVEPAALAYVIYTSGSTGRPKGVAVTRQGFENLVHAIIDRPGMSADTVLVAVTTVAFDISVLELFAPLAVGATVILASSDEAADPALLTELLTRSGATMMQATPVTWQLLLDADWVPPEGFTALCGGEKLPAQLAADLVRSGATVWDMYGPTETTVWSMARQVALDRNAWWPIANNSVYLLDRDSRPVQDGVMGELHIGGLGLARGYVGKPALTAERFVPDPFSSRPGSRMYCSGDVAQGSTVALEILGRKDHQVKIRGFRIELGEVEDAIATHPGVRAAVASTRGEGAEVTLVGYFIPAGTRAPDGSELHAFLSGRLPEYMLPTEWVSLVEFPLTASGKIDRAALPAPSVRPQRTITAPPGTPTEKTIAAVWSRVLGVEEIGIHEDFFQIGGQSLLALKVIGDLRRDHGLTLTLRDLVSERTVAALAALSTGTGQTPEEPAAIWFRMTGSKPPLLCVHPGGGSGHWYAPLADAAGEDQPVVAFEWPGLNGTEVPLISVEQMAERYLDELRSRRPKGPYRLLGWCGGAAIAWHMAKELRCNGEDVEFSLLDPVGDLWMEQNFTEELSLMRTCEGLLTRILDGTSPATEADDRRQVVQIMRSVVDDDRGVPVSEDAFEPSWLQRVGVWRQMLEVQLAYRFDTFPGSWRLIVGDEVVQGEHEVIRGHHLDDYIARWRELTEGEVEVKRISGDHFTVLRSPHVEGLVSILMQ